MNDGIHDYEDCILAGYERKQTPNHAPYADRPLWDRPLMYVAGYYSANPTHGTRNAAAWFEPLVELGWIPIIPHMSLLLDILAPNTPEFWYGYDLAILNTCKAMFVCPDRLTEESTGVKHEIAFAVLAGIPVFYSLDELKTWMVERHVY
jgi:hypothetical protein